MLIGKELEERLLRVVRAAVSAVSVYFIGRELGQTALQATSSALTARRLTFLEESFLAGKVAQQIGTNRLKTFTEAQLKDWILTNNVTLSQVEQATLRSLADNTERWLSGRSEKFQQNYRSAIARADAQWRGAIATSSFADAGAMSVARNGALQELVGTLRTNTGTFQSDMDRLLQTEMHTYFQQGQMLGVPGDEWVYKIPRPTACAHCMRLHLSKSGSPKLYRLSEVMSNSNWGRPAYLWKFTIGPVHPWCHPAGTLITTIGGLKPIESIEPGELVWTRKGWRQVEARFDNGIRPLVEVTTSSRRKFEITADHKILTLYRSNLSYKDGDFIPAGSSMGRHVRVSVPDWSLPEGGITSAYFWGRYAGDGSRGGWNGDQIYVAFRPEENWEKFKEGMEDLFSKKVYVNTSFSPGLIRLQIYKPGLGDLVGSFDPKERVPWRILQGSLEDQVSYLAGLFDSDGGCGISGTSYQLSVRIKQERRAQETLRLLTHLGVQCTLSYSKPSRTVIKSGPKEGQEIISGEGWRIYIRGRNALERFLAVIPLQEVSKKEACELALSRLRKSVRTRNVDDQGIIERIEKIDPAGEGQVYDLQVRDCHEYVANGLLVHNCYCILYRASDQSAPGDNRELALARRNILRKAAEGGPIQNSCGLPSDPSLLFEDAKPTGHADELPAHQLRLIAALRNIYGDRLPGS